MKNHYVVNIVEMLNNVTFFRVEDMTHAIFPQTFHFEMWSR